MNMIQILARAFIIICALYIPLTPFIHNDRSLVSIALIIGCMMAWAITLYLVYSIERDNK